MQTNSNLEESKVFITPSKRSKVFKFLHNKPNANIQELYSEFPYIKHELLQLYKWDFRKRHAPSIMAEKEHLERIKEMLFIFNTKVALTTQLSIKEQSTIKYFEDLVKDK